MSAHNIGIYFSQAEARVMLNHYSKLVREGKAKKIDYDVYRALKDSTYGFYVNEDYVSPNYVFDLFITDGKFELYVDEWGEKHFIKNGGDKFLTSFKMCSDFGYFLYTEYLLHRSDYSPHKENRGETMRLETGNVVKEYWTNSSTGTDSTSKLVYNTYTNKTDPYDGLLSRVSLADEYTNVARTLDELIDEKIDTKLNNNEKEKDSMKGFNFNFGPCTGDNIKISVYGLAIQNINGEWVSYDTKSGQIMNVDLLNFDGRKFMFKMPVAIKDIAKGDIVIHNKVPMFVLDIKDDGVIAVDVRAGEEKKILPTNSPFGFNFVTKVVSMFNAFNSAPTPDAPFGNFLPFMMISEDNEIDPFVMCMMMQNMNNAQYNNMFSNPMMMYFLMKDGGVDKDFMLPMLMMQAVGQPTSEVIKSNK